MCVVEPNNRRKLHAVVHSGAQIDDLQNFVKTMGSHSTRKYFLTFDFSYIVFDVAFCDGYATPTGLVVVP